ncbi:hypothetical protein VTI74DRAFT_10411 [Chaetomium olivicolor]
MASTSKGTTVPTTKGGTAPAAPTTKGKTASTTKGTTAPAKKGICVVSFTNAHKRTTSAENAVISYSQTDSRDLATAIVKCTPKSAGEDTWHVGGSNPNAPEHLTVEFKDSNGNHVTTKHIDRNGRAC